MAFNSTPRRRFGVALGVILTGVTAGLIGFAGVASAHTYDLTAKCEGEKTVLSVKLWSYNGSKPNTIKVVDGDKEIFKGEFRDKFEKKFTVAGDVAHTFTVSAKAWDGPDNKKWSCTEKRSAEACVTPTETTTTTTESTMPPSWSRLTACGRRRRAPSSGTARSPRCCVWLRPHSRSRP